MIEGCAAALRLIACAFLGWNFAALTDIADALKKLADKP